MQEKEAALSARKMRARAALLDTLGVEALDGAPEREPFRSRHRALEAPLNAEKISEVSPAFPLESSTWPTYDDK